jgi:HPt (histidine-containing phosphotransfer) domain-containing protein
VAALRPDDIPPGAQAGFERLQAQFRQGLPARASQIDAADSAKDLADALHRLAGAAGSFGYAELGALARSALSLAETGAAPSDLSESLQALRQCIAKTVQGPGG